MLRLHKVRKVSQLQYSHGYTYATPNEITNTFVMHLSRKYITLVDNDAMTTFINLIHPCGQRIILTYWSSL